MVWNIYRLTNTATGAVYIGQTKRTVRQRWNSHKLPSQQKPGSRIGAAIRKYGPEAFLVEHLACCLSWQDADFVESLLIDLHDSIRNGYNLCAGGQGAPRRFCKRGHELSVVGQTSDGKCVVCRREWDRARCQREREVRIERARKWWAANKDQANEKQRIRYETDDAYRNMRLNYHKAWVAAGNRPPPSN